VRSQFDTCLAEGLPLLITDVDVDALVKDPRFIHVLISRNKFIPGKHPFKIAVSHPQSLEFLTAITIHM
jgi:predicted ferric reductase